MCPQKRTKKIMIFVFFDLLCSFLLFLPDLVNKMSSNRGQKRTKKIMPPGKSQDVLCLFCCWTPPKFLTSVEILSIFDERDSSNFDKDVENIIAISRYFSWSQPLANHLVLHL